jgi:FAD/FMN-containing dehydrogenase
VNHTGIGGLILGGGVGWLCGKHGLAVDNLLSAELVLADGSIVLASDTENTDLFWAVRGCGASFAICTEFVLQGHEQTTPVWAGMLAFTMDKLADVVKFANKHHELAREKEAMFLGVGTLPGIPVAMIVAVLFYNGPELAAKEYFEDLIHLGPVMNQTGPMPYEEVNGLLNASAQHGGRKTQAGTSAKFPLDLAFMQGISDSVVDLVAKDGPNYVSVLVAFFILPNQKINSVP